MTMTKLIAALVLSAAVAAPAFAKDQTQTHKGAKQHHSAKLMKDRTARADWNRQGRRDDGFWPGRVAAGAIGTAGAIATAPFRDSYASYDGPYYGGGYGYRYRSAYDDPYYGGGMMAGTNMPAIRYYSGANEGMGCGPGGWYIGGDGVRHPCPY